MAPVATYEHEDPLPDGDGVLLPESDLGEVALGTIVEFVHLPTGGSRSGVVVAFEEGDDRMWVAVRFR